MKTRRDIRRIAVAASVALVAVALCAPAARAAEPTPTLIGPKGKEVRGKWHRWLVQSRMPMIRGRVRLILGPCPGVARFAGCVFTRNPRRLYIRREARAQKAVLYHELGHTFDLLLLRHKHRRAFRRMMHLGKRGWFAGDAAPSELWAESYAMCSRFGLKRPPGAQARLDALCLPLPADPQAAPRGLRADREGRQHEAPAQQAEAAARPQRAAGACGAAAGAPEAAAELRTGASAARPAAIAALPRFLSTAARGIGLFGAG